jgi:hypothetical protein
LSDMISIALFDFFDSNLSAHSIKSMTISAINH